jgi:hypothetical protein
VYTCRSNIQCDHPAGDADAHEIIQNLNYDGVVKSYGLVNYRHVFALILEDFGGQSLAEFLTAQHLSISQFSIDKFILQNMLLYV